MTAPVPDFYTLIHKAIRLALCEYLVALGVTDAANEVEWQAAVGGWVRIKRLLDAHSLHEDTYIHPLIRRVAPAIADVLDGQHHALDDLLGEIDALVVRAAHSTDPIERLRAARAMYQKFSIFMSRYFDHLLEEESLAMPALLERCSVDELRNAHNRLIGSMPPEERLEDLPIIVRSLSQPERIGLMLATKAGAPPAFFADACRIMEGAIGPVAYRAVAAALAQASA